MLAYREIRPSPSLSRFVECFWILTGPAPAAAAPEPILPDGCMELVLNCAAPFRRFSSGCRNERQPLRMLVGQMERCIHIRPTGRVDILGIRFHPAGARAFLRTPMRELAGRTFALEDVARALDRDLAAVLDGPATARIARVEALLTRRVAPPCSSHAHVEAAVHHLVRSGGSLSLDALARIANLSPRQFERRFLDAVGLAPKRFARILRFQRVFRAVSGAAPKTHPAEERLSHANGHRLNWAAVAVECGYYDQAHLIRDFRAFAGETPSLLFAADAALTRHFTRAHRPH